MSRPVLIESLNLRADLRFDRRKKISASAFASRLLLGMAALALLCTAAAAQNFTMSMTGFTPPAINPGGNASATITLGATGGFSDIVDLSCDITPSPGTGADCQVSPTSVTPPTGASVTVNAVLTGGGTWPPAGYTITITGTSASTGSQTVSSRLTVLSVTSSFTVTVGTAVAPTSVPAGTSGIGMININPINGYSGTVTLACSSVSPLVIAPPVCSFNPQSVTVGGSTTATSQLTIKTTGPQTITQAKQPRGWYAIFLPFPLALVGIGAVARGKKTRVWGLFALVLCASTFMMMPACGTNATPVPTTPSQLITPNGTYTFTITAVDDTTGEGASNSTNGTTDVVTLTVTSAASQ